MERGADRRGAWRRAAAVAAEINAPEPPHLLGAEHIARAAISAVGRTIAAIVEGAVIEQQRLDRIALAGIAQVDRRRPGQIREIGRAAGRERGCAAGEIWGGAG